MGSTKPSTAFIGLGAMGFGMATNLIRVGYPVTGFDLYEPTLERFRQAGGLTATSPAEAVAGKNFCVVMVATAEQAQSIIFDGEVPLVKALPKDAVLLLCSTVPCGYVQGLQQELIQKGRGDIALVDCPVSGGAGRAADGTLSIMAGAADESISRGLHLLQAMSDPAKLYIVKGGIGAGSNMKMCHQVLAANQILSSSEALGFASHLGLDLAATGKALVESEGWSWMLENRLPRLLHPEFLPVASAVTIILKDTSIITSEARRAGFPTPMTSAAEQAYFAGLGRGFGPDDDSSLLRLYTEGKGRVGPVKPVTKTEDAKLALVVNLLRGIHLCAAAEALAFAQFVGLDLEQVLELCVNAAGGSKMLSGEGRRILDAFAAGTASRGWAASGDGERTLRAAAQELQEAVDEAQRLKMPLFLGAQALNLIRGVLRSSREKAASDLAVGSVVSGWTA
ncbi:oxidoreductase [Colletotrichum plurivorum]|uniref:Oxidoreductase n=1 Tax=Colletotrichum plurivorum TaxID=2175906 RepID=A0A8H6KRX3_9PEZI|nr:oxidoreductase [Colletotrichum plurivorum]